jgi:hypothetical protein
METKICNYPDHKGERKTPIGCFYPSRRTPDGLSCRCIPCERARSKKYRDNWSKDPEWCKRENDRKTRYRRGRGKAVHMYMGAQGRAHKQGLEFSITKEDIVIPDVCPVLGIKIKAGQGRKWDPPSKGCRLNGAQDSSPSLDRINNSKGYIKGNVRVISWRANYLKHTATFDELILLGEDAKRLKHQMSEDDRAED